MTCPPVNPSRAYMDAYSDAGLVVVKFSVTRVDEPPSDMSDMDEPMICFTRPACKSIHGRNFIFCCYKFAVI